jgi:hypothetical protein
MRLVDALRSIRSAHAHCMQVIERGYISGLEYPTEVTVISVPGVGLFFVPRDRPTDSGSAGLPGPCLTGAFAQVAEMSPPRSPGLKVYAVR